MGFQSLRTDETDDTSPDLAALRRSLLAVKVLLRNVKGRIDKASAELDELLAEVNQVMNDGRKNGGS